FVERVLSRRQPPGRAGRLNRIYYATQAEKKPPTFMFSVRDDASVDENYRRFLEKSIRTYFEHFEGVGMRFRFKGHHDAGQEHRK
ncbi:MAG: ribosome biogenesis GTPase Der, partial [bacterium]